MLKRLPTPLLAGALTALLVLVPACSSSSSDDHDSTAPTAGTSAAPTSAAPAPTTTPGAPTTSSAAGTLAPVVAALDALTSVHLDIDAGALGGVSSADVALDHGSSTGMLIHTVDDGVQADVLSIGGRAWVRLPTPLEAGKPWTVLSAQSSNATVKDLADPIGVVQVTTLLADADTIGALVQAGGDAASEQTTLDGAPATHWTLTIDPAALARSSDLGQLLTLAGTKAIPAQLWADAQSRPLKVSLDVEVLGKKSTVTIGLSRFDEPLQLAAPDPAQVGEK